MSLVCANCGNKLEFKKVGSRTIEIKRIQTITQYLDTDEEIQNTNVEASFDDDDEIEEIDNDLNSAYIECDICDSTDVINLIDDDYKQWDDGKSIHEQKNFDKVNKTFVNSKGKIDNLKNKIMEG